MLYTTPRVWYVLNDITLISHDGCRFPLAINNITEPRNGMVAQVLALPPHSKKVMGSIPACGTVGSGGKSSPDLQCSGGLGISRSLCVEFACSPSVHKNPNSTLSYQSLTKMDGSVHLVPGRLKAALGSWRKDNPGWGNAETKFTATSGLPACVCVC